MSIDNRTLLNNASSQAGWIGDDSASTTTAAGDFYEGGSSLSTQLSNSLEHMYTTNIGGTRNMSNASVWFLSKDNLQETKANGGGQIVLFDGTDRIGFYCNGNDSPGLSLPSYYNCLKLDVTNRAVLGNNAYAGSAANLTTTNITGVGYGTIHASKANGAIDNVWMDASYFLLNTDYALTINGGTVGTPETWADVAADDVINGWGMVANLQGSKYDINGSWEWGDTGNANSFFVDNNFQTYIDARDMGTGNFIVRTVAGTGTNVLDLSSGLFQNLGTPSVWDLSDTGMNELKFTGITWTDVGSIVFPVQSIGNRFLNGCIFNNCGQITPSTMDMDNVTFNGSSNANGAILLDEGTSSNMSGLTFNSDGTGHAIELNPTGAGPFTYTFDNWRFNDYANNAGTAANRAIRYNPVTPTANATINIINGGDTPSFVDIGSGTLTILNTVTVSVTAQEADGTPITPARVRLEAAPGGDLPSDEPVTITTSGTTATVTHTAHGRSTGEFIIIRGANESELTGREQITVIDADTYTYQITSIGGASGTGTILATYSILSDDTDVDGLVEDTGFSFSAVQPIRGVIRKSTASPFFQSAPISGAITSGGFNVTVTMSPDE